MNQFHTSHTHTLVQLQFYANTTMAKKQVKNKAVKPAPRKARVSATTRDFNPTPESVAAYAATLAHPFDGPKGVGIPRWPALPTQKETVKAYSTMIVGTTGLGFVLCNHSPIGSATANVANLYHTTVLSAFTGFSTTTSANLIGTPHNGGVSTADYSNFDMESRVVSVGLRMRYIGRSDEMAGNVLIVHSPYDRTLAGVTPSLSHEFPSTASLPVSRTWTTVVWTPTKIDDFAFQGASSGAISSYLAGQIATMGLMVTGAQPGASFEVEYILNYEFAGNLARGASVNDSHTDHVEHVANTVRGQHKGFFSGLLSKYGGRALELGHKLAGTYFAKNKGAIMNKVFSLAGKAAPLALTL